MDPYAVLDLTPGATPREVAAANRRRMPPELLLTLAEYESVHLVTPTWTRSSPETLLAVTDRRLLWLHGDKVVPRVRSLPYKRVREIDHRLAPPRRRGAI